jgi:flap endonuclease GEN
MGVSQLWAYLRKEGLVKDSGGRGLIDTLDGRTVALDVSSWVVQSHTQNAYLHDKMHVRLAFQRLSQWLRCGVLPVLVLEGKPPVQKAAERRRRLEVRVGGKVASFSGTGDLPALFKQRLQEVGQLAEALGVPVVQAPGEAEVMCAWLYETGVVDGVATDDGDALVSADSPSIIIADNYISC